MAAQLSIKSIDSALPLATEGTQESVSIKRKSICVNLLICENLCNLWLKRKKNRSIENERTFYLFKGWGEDDAPRPKQGGVSEAEERR